MEPDSKSHPFICRGLLLEIWILISRPYFLPPEKVLLPPTLRHISSCFVPLTVSKGESYLLDAPQISSAFGSFQNEGFLAAGYYAGSISELEYGYACPDFRQTPIVGMVELYDRHMFLCYKNPEVWPPRIEAAEFDCLSHLLVAALAVRNP